MRAFVDEEKMSCFSLAFAFGEANRNQGEARQVRQPGILVPDEWELAAGEGEMSVIIKSKLIKLLLAQLDTPPHTLAEH